MWNDNGRRWVSRISHKSFESPEIPTLLQLMYIWSFYIYKYKYIINKFTFIYTKCWMVVVLYKRFPADVVWLPDTRFTPQFSQLFNVNFPLTINSLGNLVTIRLLAYLYNPEVYTFCLINHNLSFCPAKSNNCVTDLERWIWIILFPWCIV